MDDKMEKEKNFIKELTKILGEKDKRFKILNLNMTLDEKIKELIDISEEENIANVLISYLNQQIEILDNLKKELVNK